MQYSGLEVIFRRAEHEVKGIPMASDSPATGDPAQIKAGLTPYFDYLNGEMRRMLQVTDEQRRTMMQYMLYVKAHESAEVNYDLIYKVRYIR